MKDVGRTHAPADEGSGLLRPSAMPSRNRRVRARQRAVPIEVSPRLGPAGPPVFWGALTRRRIAALGSADDSHQRAARFGVAGMSLPATSRSRSRGSSAAGLRRPTMVSSSSTASTIDVRTTSSSLHRTLSRASSAVTRSVSRFVGTASVVFEPKSVSGSARPVRSECSATASTS